MIRDFRTGDFEGLVTCYRTGFPNGHSRYGLSRIVRYHMDTTFVAEESGTIVGMVIGVVSPREAWLTSLTVLPEPGLSRRRYSMKLLQGLGERLRIFGFGHVMATTERRSVISLASLLQAELLAVEENFYFDGKRRWIYRADMGTLQRLDLRLRG